MPRVLGETTGKLELKLGERTFSENDQQEFALLSGDFNPIHLNNSHARKLISGQCIVHGIHSMLWALEAFLGHTGKVFGKLSVSFSKPIYLNEIIEANWIAEKNQLVLVNNSAVLVSIQLADEILEQPNATVGSLAAMQSPLRVPKDLKISDIEEGQAFEFSFSGDANYAKQLFPLLSEFFGIELICRIASLSAVIGMQVPGLHSIFSKAKISLKPHSEKSEIKIKQVDDRFNLVVVSCQTTYLSAQLDAFFRPQPTDIPSCNVLRRDLDKLDLQRVNALIIGGSRGLGAWTAKVIAMLGGEVTLTYNAGKTDAEAIQSDIKSAGGNCNVAKLSLDSKSATSLPEGQFNQIYYFPTPKIFGKRSTVFDANLYEKFALIYVEKFQSIVELGIERGVTEFFYPSSVAIDENVKGLEEYVQAKIAGEKICVSLESQYSVRIYKPRIPRVLTDQTASIMSADSAHPLDVLLPIVKQMASVR